MKRQAAHLATIATVERETGLSADTLRVWERRYGFPAPARDHNGERVYPDDQVEKLRVIRRLIDRGLRPGKLVGASLDELSARIDGMSQASAPVGDIDLMRETQKLLQSNLIEDLRRLLSSTLLRLGLQRFVVEFLGPMNVAVGDAWARGELTVSEEHLYTEQIQYLVRQAIGSVSELGQQPSVLLTTLPGEEHQLGLLMAQACLTVEGARCVSLGVQTPASEIPRAARAHRVDVVGLSFSQAMKAQTACAMLADLRERLDPAIDIWAGGSIWQRSRKGVPGVTMIASLTDIPAAVAARRALPPVSTGVSHSF